MRCLLVIITLLLTLSTNLFIFITRVEAIPAFARKYETSCSTCHVAIPRRNAFGEAFRKNGYEIPQGDELYIKQKQVELGSPEWKEMWPRGLWPGAISPSFPIAAYAHQRFILDIKKKSEKEGGGTELLPNFEMPHELELLLGGTLGSGIGFFGEWVAFEKMKNAEGLKNLHITFSDPIGPDNLFNIKVGRFEPGSTRGYVDNDRITMEHPTTLDYRVVSGKWRMRDQQAGIELNGIVNHRIEYAAGVVNGDGTTLDANKMKDFYGRVGYKLGGIYLDGEKEIPETLKTAENWVDNSLSIGVYAYVGDSILSGKDKAGKEIKYENNFSRIGADLKAMYQNLDVRAGFVVGNDDNPDNTNKEVGSTAFFVEANYLFLPWLIGVARYGQVIFDDPGKKRVDYQEISPNLTILARPNIRLSVEAYIKLDDGDDTLRWIKANAFYVF